MLADLRIKRLHALFGQRRGPATRFRRRPRPGRRRQPPTIERDYRADRGARLLREAFGVDVDEIDVLNERLGDATEDELRGFLLDVQLGTCTRDGEPPSAA